MYICLKIVLRLLRYMYLMNSRERYSVCIDLAHWSIEVPLVYINFVA